MDFIKYQRSRSLPKKSDTITEHIKIIILYSPKKSNANLPELYSTLKPETNSDSPSAKSKGVRFISAMQETTQIKDKK